MKPLVFGLVFLAAIAVAAFVATFLADQLVAIAAPLGWYAPVLLVWPTVLFFAASRQHDL